MTAHALYLMAVLAADAGTPGDDEQLLRAKLDRRRALHAALRPLPFLDYDAARIARATPAAVRLSRLQYSLADARWSFELRRGTPKDLEALLARLVAEGVCEKAAVAAAPSGPVSGSCSFGMAVDSPTIAAATKRQPPGSDAEVRGLRTALENAATAVPDEPRLQHLEAHLRDVALHAHASNVSIEAAPGKTDGPVDALQVVLKGTAPFAGVWVALHPSPAGSRIFTVDSAELGAPRVKNGEWQVDFTLHLTAYAYRASEEGTDQRLTVLRRLPSQKRPAPLPGGLPPDPFGDGAPVFAGSKRPLKGDECRAQGRSKPLSGVDLDTLALAYVSGTRCAMLVDAQGGCHEVRHRMPWGFGLVSAIAADGVTLSHLYQTPHGPDVTAQVVLKGSPVARPPPWFCREK